MFPLFFFFGFWDVPEDKAAAVRPVSCMLPPHHRPCTACISAPSSLSAISPVPESAGSAEPLRSAPPASRGQSRTWNEIHRSSWRLGKKKKITQSWIWRMQTRANWRPLNAPCINQWEIHTLKTTNLKIYIQNKKNYAINMHSSKSV